ncbi:MAG: hypothetical protein BWY53_00493 [Parcubacteria group bacterium ADurb.Bin326]|nr:MAG: hypothetical protein BWY53_00493 [Parcubacteria group bacterium ADurb.Bin326]
MNNNGNRLSANSVRWEPINFVFYLSFVKWPILIAAIVEWCLRIFSVGILDGLLFGARLDLLVWLIRIIAFIYLGYKIFKHYGEVPAMGAFAGVVSGTILGLASSCSRFVEGFKVWKIFNVITETTIMALVGCLVVFIVVYVWDLIPNFKKK